MKAREKYKRIGEVVSYMSSIGLPTGPEHFRDVYRRLIEVYPHCGISLEEVKSFLEEIPF